jgi:hypothetical protein
VNLNTVGDRLIFLLLSVVVLLGLAWLGFLVGAAISPGLGAYVGSVVGLLGAAVFVTFAYRRIKSRLTSEQQPDAE